jgi:CheY-like chemotaxis protein
MNVLLVDDEPLMRKMVKLTLQKRGFQVFDASSGIDALVLSQEHPIDVLVTDVVMEDMDGWHLAHAIAEQHPDMPIVFTSGCPVDFEDERCKYAHCAFLAKPFQPGDLMKAISDVANCLMS